MKLQLQNVNNHQLQDLSLYHSVYLRSSCILPDAYMLLLIKENDLIGDKDWDQFQYNSKEAAIEDYNQLSKLLPHKENCNEFEFDEVRNVISMDKIVLLDIEQSEESYLLNVYYSTDCPCRSFWFESQEQLDAEYERLKQLAIKWCESEGE